VIDYGQTPPLDENDKALAIRQAATMYRETVDPDTLDRRRAQTKLDDEINRKQGEKYAAEQEAALELKQRIDKQKMDGFLIQKGWIRLPKPNERYYEINRCPFGCDDSVCFLSERSPSISEKDSTNTALDIDNHDNNTQTLRNKNSFGTVDILQEHICQDLGGNELKSIIRYLLKENTKLRKKDVENLQKAKEYSMRARMEVAQLSK
jgi:hypothetical protein